MFSKRAMERICGMLFLVVLVTVFVSGATDIYVSPERSEIGAVLERIANSQGQYLTSLSLGILGALLMIPLAGILYQVFSTHGRSLALVAAFALVGTGLMSLTSLMLKFALVSLSQDLAGTGSADAGLIVPIARALAFANDIIGFYAVITLLGMTMAALGILLIQSRALPRWLGWLAAMGGVLMILDWLDLIGVAVLGMIGFLFFLLSLLVIGIWLVLRGTREAPAAQTLR